MPLYEYFCENCEQSFELIRSASSEDEVSCPECGEPARKLLSGFAVGASGGGSGHASSGGSCGWSGG
ncbi:MAG: zinc ribbon domain-containing protein [Polyangia bacterium]